MVRKSILLSLMLVSLLVGKAFCGAESNPSIPSAGDAAAGITPGIVSSSPSSPEKSTRPFLALTETDDIPYHALSKNLPGTSRYYFIKTSGALPIHDRTFRDYVDYGAAVTIGIEQQITDNLSVTAAMDIIMLTGKWSISGQRIMNELEAEEWIEGEVNAPGDIVVEPEEVEGENLGTGFRSDGVLVITSAESLKSLNVHTDLYLFPVTINALYRFDRIGKMLPYIGGGLGFCIATRDSDITAMKEDSLDGPWYKTSLTNSETVRGMVLQFVAGMELPLYKNITFLAEANTALYDLKSFDPILEISSSTLNPAWYEGSDLTQYSYEDPKAFGVFQEEFVTHITVGIVMPFD